MTPSFDIKLGGPEVYNSGQTSSRLHISRVGLHDSAVFDVTRTCVNINEAQAAEVIAALREAFPGIAQPVSPEVSELLAASQVVADRFSNWESAPRVEVKRFLNAVRAAS